MNHECKHRQLAANLKRLEELEDQEGVDQLWQVYGYQDCLRAESAAKKHAGPLPAPDVWEPGKEEQTTGRGCA